MRVGFAGLGLMGRPMATTLLRSGQALTVYNRSPAASEALRALGVDVAATTQELFDSCDAVLLVLADDVATNTILARHLPQFAARVGGKLIINMGTHSPRYSQELAHDVIAAGGRFAEAPVSGSQEPAITGRLVAMVAGEPATVAAAAPLIAPMCRRVVEVGAIPAAMTMKLAVNHYLITMVTALAEATRLATVSGLDLSQFASVIGDGPLGSSVATAKLTKMTQRDFTPQATIRDVVKNARLVAQIADDRVVAPLLMESLARFERVLALDGGALDMAAVLTSYEPRETER